MRTVEKHLRTLAITTLACAAPLASAHAQTVEAAVERFDALVEEMGIKIEWTSVDISGSDAVLVGVSVGADQEMAPIGNITLTGISEVDNGYRIETVSLDDYQTEDDGSSFSAEGIRMGGVILPDEGEQDAYGGFLFYETADVSSMAVNVEGKDVFTMSDMHVEATAPVDGSAMDFTGAVEGFTVDLSVVEDPQQKAVIQALGYEQIKGYMEMAGSWLPTDGRLTLSQYDMSVVDAGTLGLTIDLGGYTSEFIASLRELQTQMEANPEGDNSAQGLAMLGLMQQLSFHEAEIAFTDDSLTGKVLEFVAQSQGMSASDIKNQAKAVLPFALAQLNNPDFTAAATQAVSTFLDDPQVLRVTASPAEPVPFALIMAEGMSTPQGLIKTLGVTVTANE